MDKNYEFFMKTDVSQYIGKWIAICDEKIVSIGDNPKDVFNKAKSMCKGKKPLLTKVPEQYAQMLISHYKGVIIAL